VGTAGRGRKTATWVSALYVDAKDEFRRLRHAGLKVSRSTLMLLVRGMLKEPVEESNGVYGAEMIVRGSNGDECSMMSKISSAWITRMCAHFGIVSRRQTWNLALSEEKQLEREKAIAHHMGTMKRGFSIGELKYGCVETWMRLPCASTWTTGGRSPK
jgi:hypothetical protein